MSWKQTLRTTSPDKVGTCMVPPKIACKIVNSDISFIKWNKIYIHGTWQISVYKETTEGLINLGPHPPRCYLTSSKVATKTS